MVNIWIWILLVINCTYYIKQDIDLLNARMNSDASLWGNMKGWEWMVLLILFWILLPLYSWKREQLFKENLEYGEDYYIRGSPVLPLGKKVIEVLAMFFIPFILAFVAGMMSLENPDQSN